MSADIDLERALRQSLSVAARHAPTGELLAERIIDEARRDLGSAGRSPRRRSRQWRTWALPLIAAGSVAAIAGAVVGVSQLRHSAAPVAPGVSVPPAPSPLPSVAPRPSPVPNSGATGPGGVPLGAAVPAGFTPASATFVSAGQGWVLGRADCASGAQLCGALLRTTDGGATWAGIPLPAASVAATPDQPTPTSIAQVRFADARDGWAYRGALYSTHDGGASWSAQHLGGPRAGVDALETGGGSVWALVDSCFGPASCQHSLSVYRSPIGSDNWHLVAGPYGNANGRGYEQGQLLVHHGNWWLSLGNTLYAGSVAGSPLRRGVSCPAGMSVAAVAVADAQHLDALCEGTGAAGSARLQLLGTIDGGASWVLAGPSFLGPDSVQGIADNGVGVLLLANSSGGSVVSRTTDDGASFSTVLEPANTGGLPWNDLGFTTADQAFAILPDRAFYLSRDAGKTWTALNFAS